MWHNGSDVTCNTACTCDTVYCDNTHHVVHSIWCVVYSVKCRIYCIVYDDPVHIFMHAIFYDYLYIFTCILFYILCLGFIALILHMFACICTIFHDYILSMHILHVFNMHAYSAVFYASILCIFCMQSMYTIYFITCSWNFYLFTYILCLCFVLIFNLCVSCNYYIFHMYFTPSSFWCLCLYFMYVHTYFTCVSPPCNIYG